MVPASALEIPNILPYFVSTIDVQSLFESLQNLGM